MSIDDVPTYKSYRTSGSAISIIQNRVVTTMNNDTLIWSKHAEVRMPKTNYESTVNSIHYWVLSFAGTDFTMYFNPSVIGRLGEEMVNVGVLTKDGKLDMEALKTFEKEHKASIEPILDMERAIEHRKKLAERPDYENYTKQLARRSPGNELEAGPVSIAFKSPVGAPAELVGFIKKEDGVKGTTYNIYRHKDKEFVGSIFYETQTGRVFIHSWLDKGSKEYNVNGPFDGTQLYYAVKYLIDYGYL